MAEADAAPGKTEVRAALEGVGGERRFVIQNIGRESAYNVHFVVEPEAGKNSPLVASEHDKKFPVEELRPGEEESLSAIITTGTGIRFRSALSWRNPDGSHGEKELELSP